MSIASDLIRGHTETIILSQLQTNDSYGYEINKKVSEITEGGYELKEATLYSAFKRLEELNMIKSYWGNEGVGARRKYYSITPLGEDRLSQNILEWDKVKKLIDLLVSKNIQGSEEANEN